MPETGAVAFRRDRVPLSAVTMAGLSSDLEILARNLTGQAPPERTAAARMLALAMVLDPANARARELSAARQNGPDPADANPARIDASHARTWKIIAWLETADAGVHGNALADCLKDVIVVSDPTHPQAAVVREAGEKGAWAGWVPALQTDEAPESTAGDPEEFAQSPEVEVASGEGAILLPKARVFCLLWQRVNNDKSGARGLIPASLRMTAEAIHGDDKPPFSIVIGSGGADVPPVPLAGRLETLMRTQHGTLPRGFRIRIYSREINLSPASGNPQPISAAAAVLVSAAITGREPEAIVIGHIDESGTLGLPPYFWDQILALGPGNGRRLVLPAAAADWLPSLLALENPAFFLDYEVLLADDYRDLLDLTAKDPGEALAQAGVRFREIRERADSQETGAYLANRFVRQRLEDISQAVPHHASASMLLLHGSVKRPQQVSREVLASELRRAIRPMAEFQEPGDPDSVVDMDDRFNELYKSCRLAVDKLERHAARTDLDLLESAKALTGSLWSLIRATRRRGEQNVAREAIKNAWIDFSLLYREVDNGLARAGGDESR